VGSEKYKGKKLLKVEGSRLKEIKAGLG